MTLQRRITIVVSVFVMLFMVIYSTQPLAVASRTAVAIVIVWSLCVTFLFTTVLFASAGIVYFTCAIIFLELLAVLYLVLHFNEVSSQVELRTLVFDFSVASVVTLAGLFILARMTEK